MKGNNTRNSWDQTWLDVAETIAKRSCDPNLKVAAIVVSEDNTQLLALGYNGNYSGGPNHRESDEPGKSGFLHAEINCLLKLDYNNPKAKKMYLTHSPCRMCAKAIINAGITSVIYSREYRMTDGIDLLKSVGISCKKA
jgi:dCMP deaminase